MPLLEAVTRAQYDVPSANIEAGTSFGASSDFPFRVIAGDVSERRLIPGTDPLSGQGIAVAEREQGAAFHREIIAH